MALLALWWVTGLACSSGAEEHEVVEAVSYQHREGVGGHLEETALGQIVLVIPEDHPKPGPPGRRGFVVEAQPHDAGGMT